MIMGFGKMNLQIQLIATAPTKDPEGFVTHGDTVLATVRAYYEPKNSTEKWSNMAQFADATALFRFRKIPGVTVDATLYISCAHGRFNIINAEDVRGRGMYVEVIAREVVGSG
jgi:head-tail adaptor